MLRKIKKEDALMENENADEVKLETTQERGGNKSRKKTFGEYTVKEFVEEILTPSDNKRWREWGDEIRELRSDSNLNNIKQLSYEFICIWLLHVVLIYANEHSDKMLKKPRDKAKDYDRVYFADEKKPQLFPNYGRATKEQYSGQGKFFDAISQIVGEKREKKYTAQDKFARWIDKVIGNDISQETQVKELLERYLNKLHSCFAKTDYYRENQENYTYLKNKITEIFFEEGDTDMEKKDKAYEGYKQMIIEAIENGATQIILTGAPGTGKTRMAQEIADEIGEGIKCESDKKAGSEDGIQKYKFVQFHPSYDYTDFVEGLRPVEIITSTSEGNEKKEITFKKVDGSFKAFCRYVEEQNKEEKDPEKKYFFIIDEINRADLSKVFGELMFGLETDKRGKKFQTQYQNLPTFSVKDKKDLKEDVFEEGFYIPKNVIIIGTMNDIDRSVESMDFAMRRRFMWLEIKVNQDLLTSSFKQMFNDFENDVDELSEQLAAQIMKMNENIIGNEGKKYGLNEQYYISQGYFANLPSNVLEELKKWKSDKTEKSNEILNTYLEYVFKWRIRPVLLEYVRGEVEGDKFVDNCKTELLSSKANDDSPNNEKNDSSINEQNSSTSDESDNK
jgi:hypothetical protein